MPQVLPLSLQRRRPGRIRPELGPLRDALGRLGDPQLAVPSILIVGTNGKGSTAAMLEAVLAGHGVRTGLTTSPHLVTVEERIRIAGQPITSSALDGLLCRLAAFPELTFFETITAAAFLAFAESAVDMAVLEAGMGGSWDATRVASSAIAGITNIGTDHVAWLGESAEDRARDKGAPLGEARWAVVGSGFAHELLPFMGAPGAVDASDLVEIEPVGDEDVVVAWEEHRVELPRPLAGEHQLSNLELALALARCAEAAKLIPVLDPAAVAGGLAGVCWPGRLSECRLDDRLILLDGAHNLEGARALAAELHHRSEDYNLLFSCLDDKPVDDMARALIPAVEEIAVCQLDEDRAMPVDRIAAAFPRASKAADVTTALDQLPDPVVAAGSLRLVGALLAAAKEGSGS